MSSVYYHNTTGWAVFIQHTGWAVFRQEVDKAVSMSSVYYHSTTGWAVFSIQTGSRQSSEHEQWVLSQHYSLGCIQQPDRK